RRGRGRAGRLAGTRRRRRRRSRQGAVLPGGHDERDRGGGRPARVRHGREAVRVGRARPRPPRAPGEARHACVRPALPAGPVRPADHGIDRLLPRRDEGRVGDERRQGDREEGGEGDRVPGPHGRERPRHGQVGRVGDLGGRRGGGGGGREEGEEGAGREHGRGGGTAGEQQEYDTVHRRRGRAR
ncbi:hypothetical protein THAOC_19519, partial [Thalassiosira oceanica]